jgi:prepilin-type N-terminal cleavage/methylation domain-containing protein
MKHHCNKSGFTVLELMTVLAIIAVVSIFALPAFQEWNAKRSFGSIVNQVYSNISQAKIESFGRNQIIRISTSRTLDNYTQTIAFNPNNVACNSATGWVPIKSETFSVNTNFEITGSGVGNVCFYKDSTSSGGVFNIVQKNGQINLGSTTINVILATGFIDVTKN